MTPLVAAGSGAALIRYLVVGERGGGRRALHGKRRRQAAGADVAGEKTTSMSELIGGRRDAGVDVGETENVDVGDLGHDGVAGVVVVPADFERIGLAAAAAAVGVGAVNLKFPVDDTDKIVAPGSGELGLAIALDRR